MATSERIKWTLVEPLLNVGFDNTIIASYNLAELYPGFPEMNEVQQMVIVYGLKQNLSDKIAGMKDYTLNEKVEVMDERFQSLKDGIWKTPAKEKVSIKKKATELVEAGGLSEVELALLVKLGLK